MQYKSKHAQFERIVNKIDAPVRDIEIRSMWDGLSYADLKYKEKIQIISEKYFVSDKVVEHALNEHTAVK